MATALAILIVIMLVLLFCSWPLWQNPHEHFLSERDALAVTSGWNATYQGNYIDTMDTLSALEKARADSFRPRV